MTRSSTETHKIANSKALPTVVFAIAMISFTLNDSNARAASVMPYDYRLAAAADKFADTWQSAMVFKMRPRRRLWAKRLGLAMGTISTSQENSLFASLGRMQRPLVIHQQNVVAALANCLLARLARVVLQAFPGSFTANIKTETIGLSSVNPGIDMIGLNIAFALSDR